MRPEDKTLLQRRSTDNAKVMTHLKVVRKGSREQLGLMDTILSKTRVHEKITGMQLCLTYSGTAYGKTAENS